MNDYQALADIRRNKDAVKSLLDKYGRHRYFRLQRLDDLQQYQRRNSLRVFDRCSGERCEITDTPLLVEIVVLNKLNVDVPLSDIDRSHCVCVENS